MHLYVFIAITHKEPTQDNDFTQSTGIPMYTI